MAVHYNFDYGSTLLVTALVRTRRPDASVPGGVGGRGIKTPFLSLLSAATNAMASGSVKIKYLIQVSPCLALLFLPRIHHHQHRRFLKCNRKLRF